MSAVTVAAHEPSLRLSYARARLAEIDRMRQVYLASLDGVPQRDIAAAVHLSQASVHRLIVRARALGMPRESVEEVVLQRFVGGISTVQMLERLASIESWVPRVVDPVDGVLPGDSQADLEELCEDGLISEDEVNQVLDEHE
ncbi:hypothetical protein ET495_03020 [Xylanimonas allomyrinae]|uniref:Uncharacterized protein n=2 Tax=Xylanimonas allomyrinae TaxID=2509459 RepID=A0A4P6EQE3_9MICO|nr:hypothetical protein ET495_03020 [Xylanimonas allomyrinae]